MQTFQVIRQVRPRYLYIASDGARKERKGEGEKVTAVREYISTHIDWDCEVKTLFREKNLGCGKAVAEAITWFFNQTEQGIILEDDCLPSLSFFPYCEELLEYYKNDTRVFSIAGYNKQGTWNPDRYDYFFSNISAIWGWASYKRAWNYYDIDMSDIEQFMHYNKYEDLFGRKIGNLRQNTIYKSIKIDRIDTWDYQWNYTANKNNALTVIPSKNLIRNIGFGEDATHTVGYVKQPNIYDITVPLKRNPFLVPERRYDEKFLEYRNLIQKILHKVITIRK